MSLESSSLTPSQDANRSAILDAARDLFARYGFKKTTMEDIAMALRKGKSSLYYYFKNKEDIFQAVIDSESEILFKKLKEVVDSDLSPKDKLRNYIIVRMQTISQLANYQKVLKEDFYGEYNFLGANRKKGESVEEAYLKTILEVGVRNGVFNIRDIQLGAMSIAVVLRGFEIPLFRGSTSVQDLSGQLDNILNIFFYGLVKN